MSGRDEKPIVDELIDEVELAIFNPNEDSIREKFEDLEKIHAKKKPVENDIMSRDVYNSLSSKGKARFHVRCYALDHGR